MPLVGLILALAPSLIKVVQSLLPAGQGHGQIKADMVVSSISTLLQELQKSGKLPNLPAGADLNQIALVVETIFQSMRNTGELSADTPTPVAPVSGAVQGGDFIWTFKKGLLISVG